MSPESYDVGFGKPPKHSRFPKGVSGNCKGRPKGKRNIATVLTEILGEKIVIDENGVRRTVTKLEAALIKLVNQAASGDPVALRLMTAPVRSADEHEVEPATKRLSQDDLQIMKRVLLRQGRPPEGGTNEDHP
jgi:hypothetical protein